VNTTEQVPLTSVQLGALKVPLPVPDTLKATVPVGVVAPAPFVSATVAVQLAVWLIVILFGAQVTVVEVVLKVTVTVVVALAGALWFVSPA